MHSCSRSVLRAVLRETSGVDQTGGLKHKPQEPHGDLRAEAQRKTSGGQKAGRGTVFCKGTPVKRAGEERENCGEEQERRGQGRESDGPLSAGGLCGHLAGDAGAGSLGSELQTCMKLFASPGETVLRTYSLKGNGCELERSGVLGSGVCHSLMVRVKREE